VITSTNLAVGKVPDSLPKKNKVTVVVIIVTRCLLSIYRGNLGVMRKKVKDDFLLFQSNVYV
jgi:hypothetical protein